MYGFCGGSTRISQICYNYGGIDKYTKYGHFVSLAHPFTALQVAQAYMDHVYKLHGLPEAIISDMDRIFTCALWRDLFKLTNTQLLMSSSYHP
jgi:hypothetical protein